MNSPRVQVSPVALMSILECFSRRSTEDRVLGTLLGQTSSAGAMTITACFPIPHMEREGGIAIGKDVHKQLSALHLKANSSEVVVGWFSATSNTSRSIDPWSVLIQDFYASECADPVHLVVALSPESISVNAYRCIALSLDNEPLAAEFRPLPLATVASEPERIGMAALFKSDTPESVIGSADKLLGLLEKVSQYADDVVEGKITPNHEVGKKLAEALATVPSISQKDFATAFNNALQDLLMVVYLTSLTRAQLQIAEKLGSVM